MRLCMHCRNDYHPHPDGRCGATIGDTYECECRYAGRCGPCRTGQCAHPWGLCDTTVDGPEGPFPCGCWDPNVPRPTEAEIAIDLGTIRRLSREHAERDLPPFQTRPPEPLPPNIARVALAQRLQGLLTEKGKLEVLGLGPLITWERRTLRGIAQALRDTNPNNGNGLCRFCDARLDDAHRPFCTWKLAYDYSVESSRRVNEVLKRDQAIRTAFVAQYGADRDAEEVAETDRAITNLIDFDAERRKRGR